MRPFPVLSFLVLSVPLTAQSAPKPPAAISAIREADLERDLYIMAGDEMRGREAGTIDEMHASMWVADQLKKIGLDPLGDMGSWFQWWNMRRTRISSISSSIQVNGHPMTLWTEITPTTNTTADVSGATMFVADARDTTADVHGKIVVTLLTAPPPAAIRTTTNTWDYNYSRAALGPIGTALARRGAAAVIVVGDSVGDRAFDGVAKTQARGAYDVIGGVPRFSRNAAPGGRGGRGGTAQTLPVPILFVRSSSLSALRADGQTVDIRLRGESFEYPSTNVIGVIRGTDPKLRDEYVLFSSHQDHDGVRYAVDRDRARLERATGQTVGAVHLSRRRRARAPRLTVSRRASRRSAGQDRGGAQR